MMNFAYLLLLFFISCVTCGDVSINVCHTPLPPPPAPQAPGVGAGGRPAAPQAAQVVMHRPTVDPNLCFDLDPACPQVFNLENPGQTILDRLNP